MVRCRDLRILAAILVLIAASVSFGAEETWLRYSTVGVSGAGNLPLYPSVCNLTSDAPSDVSMPEFAGRTQYFTTLQSPMSPSGAIAVALDISDDSSEIYVDTNCDGSLADEKPINSDIMYNTAVYGPVKLVFPTDDGPVAYHILFRSMENEEGVRLYVSSACYYEGTVDVGDASYGIKLVDTNCNGTFNDAFSADATSDMIIVGDSGAEAQHVVGRYLQIAGALYKLDIARDGAYVKFSPATDVATGKVIVPEEVTTLTIAGENGSFSLAPPGNALTVPAGDYFVSRWTLQRTDDKGVAWTASAGAGADAAAINVAADGETALDISDPFKATVDVYLRGDEYVIAGGIKGRLGERIALTGGQSAPKPELRITNADGTYDKTFSLEYG